VFNGVTIWAKCSFRIYYLNPFKFYFDYRTIYYQDRHCFFMLSCYQIELFYFTIESLWFFFFCHLWWIFQGKILRFLKMLRERGKKLFLLTNSPYYFVDGGMRFMLEVFDRKETISCILYLGLITYLVSIVIKLFLYIPYS